MSTVGALTVRDSRRGTTGQVALGLGLMLIDTYPYGLECGFPPESEAAAQIDTPGFRGASGQLRRLSTVASGLLL
jgi:hypothetical protein